MFEILTENKSLVAIGFLIMAGVAAYLVRLKTRKTETSKESAKNDCLALLLVQAAFAFFTYAIMPSAHFTTEARPVVAINSLQDVETQLKNQFADAQQIRQNLDDTIELTRTFILVSGFLLPFFIFRLYKSGQLGNPDA